MKYKSFTFLLLLVFNFGCQKDYYRKTSNQTKNVYANHNGYSDSKIGEKLFLVEYKDVFGVHSAFHKALMRSSEIALLEGYKYFVIKRKEKYGTYAIKDWNKLIKSRVYDELYSPTIKNKNSDVSFSIADWEKIATPCKSTSQFTKVSLVVEFFDEKPEAFSFEAKNTFQALNQYYCKQIGDVPPLLTNESISIFKIDENLALIICKNIQENISANIELNLLACIDFCRKNNMKSFEILNSNYDSKVAKSILCNETLLNQNNDFHVSYGENLSYQLNQKYDLYGFNTNFISYTVIQGKKENGDQKLDDVYAAILKKYAEISLSKKPKPKAGGNIKLGK